MASQEQRQINYRLLRGVLHKSKPAEVILKAIARVHAGEPWLDHGSLGKLSGAFGRRAVEAEGTAHSTLTAAERKVVAAVVRHKGPPNKVVAALLRLSEHAA